MVNQDDERCNVAAMADESSAGVREDTIRPAYCASDEAIVKLTSTILTRAVQEGASHIHIEPFAGATRVRLRRDGVLFKYGNLPADASGALVTRLKILAGLNITERRVPQSGRFTVESAVGKAVDFRLHSIPYATGEGAAIRVLEKSSSLMQLADLGMEAAALDLFQKNLARPHGLLLCSGLADSGKTTTLYSALDSLAGENKKIVSAEDPVELTLQGVNQMAFRPEVGVTFASAMNVFLQPDVDVEVIMISDLRDAETAFLAAKAATRGKLLLGGVYADDCISAVARILDLGLDPYLLTSTLNLLLAQRLVRRLCPACKEADTHDSGELLDAGFSKAEIDPQLQLYRPRGCEQCNGLGYKGRVGIFELLEMHGDIARAIRNRASEEELRSAAIKSGMATLRQAGIRKMLDGTTSLEEVLRCTFDYRADDA